MANKTDTLSCFLQIFGLDSGKEDELKSILDNLDYDGSCYFYLEYNLINEVDGNLLYKGHLFFYKGESKDNKLTFTKEA